MGTAEPLPSSLVDLGLATMVLILGVFFIIVGIIIAGVIYRESREWRKMILPMFDRDSSVIVPESSEEPGGLTPRMAAFGKEIFNRLFNHMDVAGLLGGAATVIMGLIILLIGLQIGS
ncbi:MAG: hypothetical protein JSW22_06240 [Chloroflexota bacterium]|nr:MAG: hypothetical protein JSW22_06240 [Chloroflexota bacterium]